MRQRLVMIVSGCVLVLALAPAGAFGAAPQITGEGASAISATSATLEASIDPAGNPDGVYYQFQLADLPAEFPDELACPPAPSSGPFLPCIGPESQSALPIGYLPAGDGPVEVSLDLAAAGVSLNPDQTYYFRAVAAPAVASEDTIEWEKPAVGGEGASFTTTVAHSLPLITGEGASAISATRATLEASIDPAGNPDGVYYQFQLADLPAEFPDELACPPAPSSGPFLPCIGPESQSALPIGYLPAGDGPVEVSLDLAAAGVSLNPDQTYYFRAVAAPAVASEDTIEWEKPAVGGGTQTFHTSSSQIPSDPPAEAATGEGGTAQPAPPIRRKHHGKRHHRRSGRVAISRARPAL